MRSHEVDYLIIGAGPAGLQMGYFLQASGRSYMILEGTSRPGAFFEKFPRHRKLLSINKVHCGYDDPQARLRYDWNTLICDEPSLRLANYSQRYFPDADDYVRYLADFADHYKLNIQFDTRVASVSRPGGKSAGFVLKDEAGNEYHCRRLIMAAGVSRPYVPDIPGIEKAEHYWDFSVDANDFTNQCVLIIGKGNSGFETANHISETARAIHLCSPNSVRLAWKTHYVADLRAVNNPFLDTYFLKGQNASLDATIEKIDLVDGQYLVDIRFTHANDQQAQLAYDRVLLCTGFRFDPSIFQADCSPEMSKCGRLPALTSEWESTNVPDLFFAGTLMQIRDYHKTMSNVIHGFRHNIEALHQILNVRYEDNVWDHTDLAPTPSAIATHVIDRVSTAPGMFLQPGFLGDVVVVGEDKARYFNNLPVDYVRDGLLGDESDYFLVTMEYGDFGADPFRVERMPDPNQANRDAYLHPRIRRFRGGQLVSEHHISEHLESDWRHEFRPNGQRLIRSLGYIGQQDDMHFEQICHQKVIDFFEREMAGVRTMSAAGN